MAERLSERVHERLRRQILDGELAPGDAVPSERRLAEDLGVNRHAVREALKRLEQAGLVRISQGGATRVNDWRESGGLEVLLDLAPGSGPPPPDMIRSVLEMRASIGVDAARRCAQRATPEARERIVALANEAADADEDALVDERYAELWIAIVTGSGNVAYRLALNSLIVALASYEGVADLVRPSDGAQIRALGAAIGKGNADAAVRAARRLLEHDV